MAKTEDDDETLASVLISVMEERGLSQRQLGELIGASQPRISRWIGGSEGPQMDRIPAIARVAGRTEAEIAALVWKARKDPKPKRRTYAERLSDLEAELASMHEEVDRLSALVEELIAARKPKTRAQANRPNTKKAAAKKAAAKS